MVEKGPQPASGSSPAARALKLLAVAVALGLSLWYALRGVEWGSLWEAITRLNLLWIAASVTATMTAHLVRAERWRILIPDPKGTQVGLANAYSATLVGYMMNNVIPRAGEILRPYVLARRERRPFSTLLASVLVERILDGVALASIFVLLLFVERRRLEQLLANVSAQLDIGLSPSGILMTLGIPIVLLILFFMIAVRTRLGDLLVGWVERRFPGRFGGRFRTIFNEFRAGVNFEGASGTAMILLWSVVIWGCYGLSLYFGFLAFGFDTAYGMGPEAMVTVLAVTTVGISIAPTPGAFGVYHVFSKAALTTLYGVSDSDAVAFALVLHAAPYLATLIAGALCLLREGISLSEATRARESAGRESEG